MLALASKVTFCSVTTCLHWQVKVTVCIGNTFRIRSVTTYWHWQVIVTFRSVTTCWHWQRNVTFRGVTQRTGYPCGWQIIILYYIHNILLLYYIILYIISFKICEGLHSKYFLKIISFPEKKPDSVSQSFTLQSSGLLSLLIQYFNNIFLIRGTCYGLKFKHSTI